MLVVFFYDTIHPIYLNFILIIALPIDPDKTNIPPNSAHSPIFSPTKIYTQNGFNIGSIILTSIASKAFTWRRAFVYKIYGIPNWTIPKTKIMNQSVDAVS